MALEVVKGELVTRPHKSRSSDLARVTVQTHNGTHKVVVHWTGLQKSQLSPIEETLPRRTSEDIEALRELQRGVLRHSLEQAFSDDRATRFSARKLIDFYTRELRAPLVCAPIRLNNMFAIWSPRHPDGNDTAIEIGKVIDIDPT